MNILAIDASLSAVSACVLDSGQQVVIAEACERMQRGHSEAIVPLLQRVLAQVPDANPVERIAVTIGPGSFTGIRIGVAAAKALGLAWKVPVVGVSTLSAFAAPWVSTAADGLVACAIDARHSQVYFQLLARNGRTLIEPRVEKLRDAVRLLGSGPVKLVGDGAPLLAIEAWSQGQKVDAEENVKFPDIAWVARLGVSADPAVARPVPSYIKSPDVSRPSHAAALPIRA